MTVSNSPCASVSDTYTLNVSGTPTATTPSGPGNICVNGTFTMSNATASNGAILWTHNGTGTLSNATTLTPTYTPGAEDAGNAGNAVILTMTVSNGVCSDASANYTVNVKAIPTATAGGSQSICQNGTATVSGSTSSNGTIAWTEDGAGSITAGANTLTPTYKAAAGDAGKTVTLTMTVSNNPCTAAKATYTINVDPLPTATAVGNQSICATGSATVSGATATNGTILWTSNGTGTLTGETTINPAYNAAAGDAGKTVLLTMTVTSNNTCSPSTASANYTVMFILPRL